MKDLAKQILSEIGYCAIVLIIIVLMVWSFLTSAASYQYPPPAQIAAPHEPLVAFECDDRGNCTVTKYFKE